MKSLIETVKVIKNGRYPTKLVGMLASSGTEQMLVVPCNKEMIAVAAYFLAEKRGFAPGNELDDWCQAEVEYTMEHAI